MASGGTTVRRLLGGIGGIGYHEGDGDEGRWPGKDASLGRLENGPGVWEGEGGSAPFEEVRNRTLRPRDRFVWLLNVVPSVSWRFFYTSSTGWTGGLGGYLFHAGFGLVLCGF